MKRVLGFTLVFVGALVTVLLLGRRAPRSLSAAAPEPARHLGSVASFRAPEKAASAAENRSGRKFLRELVDDIRQDNYCALQERLTQKSQSGPNPERDRDTLPLRALVLASGDRAPPDPCLLALFSRTREDVLHFASKSEAMECRLVKALLLAGEWDLTHVAPPATPEERKQGLELLADLVREYPENGFFAFMKIGALPPEESRAREEAYRDFLRAGNFVNPLAWPVKERLMQLSKNNTTAWLLSSELSSGWVDFVPTLKAVKAFPEEARAPAEFPGWVQALAERFEATDREGLIEPFVSLFDDAPLRRIVLMGEHSLPAMPKIFEQENWVAYFKRRHPWDPSEFVANETCDHLLERARGKFPQIVRSNDEKAELVRRVRM